MSDKPKKRNTAKIVIIVLLVLVLIGGAAFAGMYFFGNKGAAATTNTPKVAEIIEVTYSLDEFLINLTDDEGRRYLKADIFIGYEDNKKLTEELVTKKPIIRDVVIATLRLKKTTDFSDTGIDVIKNELIAKVNPILTKGKISHIYFNAILVQ